MSDYNLAVFNSTGFSNLGSTFSDNNGIAYTLDTSGGGLYYYKSSSDNPIGNNAFTTNVNTNFNYLVNFSCGNNVTIIRIAAFANCSNLTNITLNNSLLEIGNYGFQGTGLINVNIPISVGGISRQGFNNCSNLTSVIFNSTTIPLPINDNNVFDLSTGGPNVNCKVYVPAPLDDTNTTKLTNNGILAENIIFPQPPTNVTATTYGYGDATITWIAPSGETVTNYVVTSTPPTSSVTTTSISTVITGLKNHEIYTFTVTANLNGGTITSANSNPVTSNYPCFLIGSKILTDKGYIAIENLRKGDLVKTFKNDYLPIVLIGKSPIYNSGNLERIKNRLYTLPSEKYPELTEDLVLTGCHSILMDILTKEQEYAILANYGAYPITDGKVRLESYLDDKAEPYPVKGTFTIYHLALENENYFSNYGIWANGLLVESCSKRYLTELSNMELIE